MSPDMLFRINECENKKQQHSHDTHNLLSMIPSLSVPGRPAPSGCLSALV